MGVFGRGRFLIVDQIHKNISFLARHVAMASVPDQDRVALAKIVIAHREHVNALEPLGKGILGTTLRYDYEGRDERIAFLTCRRAAQPARPWFSVRGVQPYSDAIRRLAAAMRS